MSIHQSTLDANYTMVSKAGPRGAPQAVCGRLRVHTGVFQGVPGSNDARRLSFRQVPMAQRKHEPGPPMTLGNVRERPSGHSRID